LTALPSKENCAAGSVAALDPLPTIPRPRPDEGIEPAVTRLQFAVDAEGRTYLAHQFATYPHHLTRPLYLDRAAPQAATVYLQSLSGGLTQSDRVAFVVSARGRAIAHVTTQAATKVHSMEHGFALQQLKLDALEEAHLEYIADPTICFPRSRLVARTDLCVAAGASAIVSDSYLWHDPCGKDAMAFDTLSMETAIRRPDGRLVALDRSCLPSPQGLSGNPALLGPYRALGTLFAVGRDSEGEAALAAVRTALEPLSGIYPGVSRLPAEAGLWIRILASEGATLRAAMDCAWRQCHHRMLGWSCERRRK
jgi:urease accessory protein